MTTLTHNHGNSEVHNFIYNYFEEVARTKVPRRLKRLVYISSIYGLIQRSSDTDMKLMTKLNNVLRLANSANAYLLPMRIRSMIWHNVSNDTLKLLDKVSKDNSSLTDEECSSIGAYFADVAPSWLKYGSDELMACDIKMLINQLRAMKPELH